MREAARVRGEAESGRQGAPLQQDGAVGERGSQDAAKEQGDHLQHQLLCKVRKAIQLILNITEPEIGAIYGLRLGETQDLGPFIAFGIWYMVRITPPSESSNLHGIVLLSILFSFNRD